ncbi:MAG: hypothetical protein AABZ39_19030 [Spirochaetota bacterium]
MCKFIISFMLFITGFLFAGTGNLIMNGDFEELSGDAPAGWTGTGDKNTVPVASTEGAFMNGKTAARLKCLNSEPIPGAKSVCMITQKKIADISGGKEYRLSFYARSPMNGQTMQALFYTRSDVKPHYFKVETFAIKPMWTKFVFVQKLPPPEEWKDRGLFIRFDIAHGEVFIDDVQLIDTAASISIADNAKPGILHVTPLGVKGIFSPEESVIINIMLKNTPASTDAWKIQWKCRDFDGKTVFERTVPLTLDANGICRLEAPTIKRTGFFSVTIDLLSPEGQIVDEVVRGFCIMPQQEGKNDPFFGSSGFRAPLWMRDTMKRIGIGLMPVYVLWSECEPRPGEFDFSKCKEADLWWSKAGFKTKGFVMCQNSEYVHAWVTPKWELENIAARKKSGRAPFSPEFYDLFKRFAKNASLELADRFDGEWNLMYEIDIPMRMDFDAPRIDYVNRVRAFYEGVKESGKKFAIEAVGVAAPDIVKKPSFPAARAILADVHKYIDSFGPHFYPMPKTFSPGQTVQMPEDYIRDQLLDAADVIRPYGKHSLGDDEIGYQLGNGIEVDHFLARKMAVATARLFLLARTVPELKEMCMFTVMQMTEGRASFGLWEAEGGGDLSNYSKLTDESSVWPRPVVAAYATTTRMTAHAVHAEYLSVHKDMPVCVYRKKNEVVAALWTGAADPLGVTIPLSTGVRTADLMGNTTGSLPPGTAELTLTDAPLFLIADVNNADALVSSVKAARVNGASIALSARMSHLDVCELKIGNLVNRNRDLTLHAPGAIQVDHAIRLNPLETKLYRVPLAGSTISERNGTKLIFSIEDIAEKEASVNISLHPAFLSVAGLREGDDALKSIASISPAIILDSQSHLSPPDAFPFWKGPADASVQCRLGWDEKGMCLLAEVRDDVHIQNYSNLYMYQQDSLVFSLNIDEEDRISRSGDGFLEIFMSYQDAPNMIITRAPAGSPFADRKIKPEFTVRKAGENSWVYQCILPWAAIMKGVPQPGKVFKMNVVYMDADNPNDKAVYWLQLTGGIHGGPKDPGVFRDFVLSDK